MSTEESLTVSGLCFCKEDEVLSECGGGYLLLESSWALEDTPLTTQRINEYPFHYHNEICNVNIT